MFSQRLLAGRSQSHEQALTSLGIMIFVRVLGHFVRNDTATILELRSLKIALKSQRQYSDAGRSLLPRHNSIPLSKSLSGHNSLQMEMPCNHQQSCPVAQDKAPIRPPVDTRGPREADTKTDRATDRNLLNQILHTRRPRRTRGSRDLMPRMQ